MTNPCLSRYLPGAAMLLLATAATAPAAPPPVLAAVRAASFLGSICINTRLEYTDGAYASAATVIADLAWLGIRCLREGTPNPSGGIPYLNYISSLNAAAAAGNRFDFVAGTGQPIATSLAQIDRLATAYPGSVIAVEGLNEINNWVPSYAGLTGNAAAVAFQGDLYAAVKADPALRGVRIYDFTGGPWVDLATSTGRTDDANMHPYPTHGEQPAARIHQERVDDYGALGNHGKVITETGYYDQPTNPYGGGVDDATQAKGTLNMLLAAFNQGFSRTYLYQLLSAYPDPNGTNVDVEYGLFRQDNSPRPAAAAIHALTTLLADPGPNAGGFPIATPGFTVAGLPTSTGYALLLEKSSGVYDLLVWTERTFWNNTTHAPIVVPPVTATITLGASCSLIRVFDPTQGTLPSRVLTNASTIAVGITDHPMIIEITP